MTPAVPAGATIAIRSSHSDEIHPKSAVIWILLAGMIGTLVSQLTAMGG